MSEIWLLFVLAAGLGLLPILALRWEGVKVSRGFWVLTATDRDC